MSGERMCGLSALPPSVARTVAHVYGHHRTPWFEGILARISERLRSTLGGRYTPLFLTCTAVGGREALISNLIRLNDRVQSKNGYFARLSQLWGADVEAIGERPGATDVLLIEHVAPDGT